MTDAAEEQPAIPTHDLLAALDEHPDKPAPLTLVQAEVEQETAPDPLADCPPGTVLVPLGTGLVAVLPDKKWPNSANSDIARGLYAEWAQKALARDEDVDTWFREDVDNEAVERFFIDWATISGRDLKAGGRRNTGRLRTA